MGHIKGDKIIFLQSTVLISAQTPKFGEPTHIPPKIRINIIESFWPTNFSKL